MDGSSVGISVVTVDGVSETVKLGDWEGTSVPEIDGDSVGA